MTTFLLGSDGGDTYPDWTTMQVTESEGDGDTVSFRKGETFRETITVPDSGSSTVSRITYNAHGDGADPIINGADIITTWTGVETNKTFTALDTNDGNAGNATYGVWFRNIISSADGTGVDGAQIRIQLKARSDQNTTVLGCSIGEREGSTADFDATPSVGGAGVTRVTFDSGSAGCTVTAGGTKWSDWVNYTYDSSNNHLIHLQITRTGATCYYISLASYLDGVYFQLNPSADDTLVEDVTEQGDIANFYNIQQIESRSATVWQATLTTEPYIVVMDGTLLTNGADEDSLNDHEWYWTGDVLYLRDDTGDPDGSVTIEASIRENCITADGKSYITIDGIDIKYAQGQGILLEENGTKGEHNIVQDCTISYVGHEGIWTENNDTDIDNVDVSYYALRDVEDRRTGIRFTQGWGTTTGSVTDSTVHDSSYGQGITLAGVDAVTVSGCLVHDTKLSGIKMYQACDNCIIEDNEVYTCGEDAGGGGIQIYSGTTTAATGNIIRYNIVHDCTWLGIYLHGVGNNAVRDNYVYYNIMYNNDSNGSHGDLGVDNTTGANYIYNNVIYGGNNYGIHFFSGAANQVLKNNISLSNTGVDLYVAAGATTGHTLDYNCYYRASGNIISWDGDTYTVATFSTYQSEKSQDANSIVSDPTMTDPANDDFTLQVGSPCINAGVDVSLTTDYAGNIVGALPDIGAYELIGAISTIPPMMGGDYYLALG